MLLKWSLEAGLTVLGWFAELFGALPVLTLPGGLTLVAPVPLIGGSSGALGTWLAGSVAVVLVLVAGNVLQWFYAKIPFKFT